MALRRAALVVALSAIAIPAHAVVAIDVDPCAGDPAAIEAAIALELAGADGAGRVEVGCDGELRVLRVDDPSGRQHVERTLSLAGLPASAHPRALALAIAELVAAGWIPEPVIDARADAPAPAPIELEPVAPPAPTAARGRRIALAVIGRVSSDLQTRGGTLEVSAPRGLVRGAVGLTVERGDRAVAWGEVTATAISAAARAGIELHHAGLDVELGAGLRAGVVRLSGAPDEERAMELAGAAVTGAWAAPLARLDLHARSGRAGLALGVEAGWSIATVTGALPDGGDVAWGGGFVSLHAAIEVVW